MRRILISSVMILILVYSVSASLIGYEINEKSLIVIGEDAEAEDVIGSLSLATAVPKQATSQLQMLVQSGLIKMPDGMSSTIYVGGDAVRIDSATDRLESVEKFGNVKPVVTEKDTDSLRSRTISTSQGTTEYNQYLRFETTTNTSADDYVASCYTTLTKNDDEQVNIYMVCDEDARIFEYEMEFTEGLKTDIECITSGCTSADERKLEGLESMTLEMLGSEFMIINARVDGAQITIDLVGDGVSTVMEEGDVKTLTISGKDYEIIPLIVSDVSNSAKFSINGKITHKMEQGDIEQIDDLYIGLAEILPNEAGEISTGDLVKVLIGRNKIELKDNNYTDSAAYENIDINEETIPGTEVVIRASESSDQLRINDIKYRLKAESSDFGTVYVPGGEGLRQHLRYPEAMLTGNWDIRYFGSTPDPFMYATRFDLIPKGDESYKMKFVNNEGVSYNIPFVDNSNEKSEGFKYGTEDDQLRFYECQNSTIFCTEEDDYFILTDAEGSYPSGSDTSVTRVIQYDNIDTNDKIVQFSDAATGGFSATYSGTEGSGASGTLQSGGKTYTFYVGPAPGYNLSIDQNDDGDVAHDEVNIVIKGGGIIDLGPNQTADQTGGLDQFNITLTTLAKNFDENGWLDMGLDDSVVITVKELSNNEADADITETLNGVARYGFPDEDGYFSSSAYGVSAIESDETGNSDYAKITYPEVQALPQVYVTFGEISPVPLSVIPLMGAIPLETYLDQAKTDALIDQARTMLDGLTSQSQGGTPAIKPEAGKTTKLDVDVTREEIGSKDSVVFMGGPCVNDYVEDLAAEGYTKTCEEWQDMEGTALIQKLKTDLGDIVIIAGYSGADTVRAVNVFLDKERYQEELAADMVQISLKEGNMLFS